jgi:phage terminase large subunit-like protein
MASKTKTQRKSTSADPTTQYALDVVAGKIVAGPHVRNACRRHLKDLDEGPKRGLFWDVAAANRAINFFPEVLRLAGGQFEGEPFHLHPSQKFKTGSIFGWKRADGTRRFRRAYIEEGKGNGKSPWAAGIGHYCLVADGEQRAEVYAAAADKDQAMVLFRDAVAMREQSPALSRRLTPSGGNPVWNLADLATGSFFRPISSEKRKSGSGPRPSCALCDEVHEHPDGLMIEMLERGFKWRRQPLLLMTTNSGSDRNSVCRQEHDHAIRVAAGAKVVDERAEFVGEVIDDETFSFVCSIDKDDDPLEDPSCWPKANPLLGITVKEDYLASVVRQAKAIPGRMNGILRLHFCVWTDADQAWMSRRALEAVLSDFDPLIHSGESVHVGLDLSATQDMTAVGYAVQTGYKAVNRDDGTTVDLPCYDAWIEAWTPLDTLAERALRDKAPYEDWVQQGHLNATPGKMIGFDYVAARLAESASIYVIAAAAYDSYGFKKHFEPHLDSLGLTLPVVEHPQGGKKKGESGLWMPGSKLTLETLILEGRIRLKRNPVLISAMMSAAVEEDPFGNAWFSKRRAVNRIDALVALAMAIGSATAGEDEVSVWDLIGKSNGKSVPKTDIQAQSTDDGEQIDYTILRDTRHPMFAVMKERFERKQARQIDEDF